MCISWAMWSLTRCCAASGGVLPGSTKPGQDPLLLIVLTIGWDLSISSLHCLAKHCETPTLRSFAHELRYTGNSNCTAVPNYHLPYLGAAHQDEVTFVLGQPNFMEDGSCCGIWGLTTPDCPHLERCEACYAPSRFGHEGYRAYFNDKEWAFARTVGSFWTNVAASGDPNCRDASVCGSAWPKFDRGEVTQLLGVDAPLDFHRL